MTAAVAARPIMQVGDYPSLVQLGVDGGAKIYEGTLVGKLTATGYACKAGTASMDNVLGVAKFTVDNTSGSDGDLSIDLLQGLFWFENYATHPVTQAHFGEAVFAVDDKTISSDSGDGVVAGICLGIDTDQGVLVGIGVNYNYLLSQATLEAELAAVTATNGANKIGYEDAGSFTTAATADAALDQIYQHLLSATGIFLSVPLSSFRECDANGDVGNAAANGGVLASDTTPILLGAATTLHQQISWAAGNSDPIVTSLTLPPDFSGAADVTLEFWVSSGTTDAADLAIQTSWDGGTIVADAVDDSGTKSATAHKVTATIAAADIPDTARNVTIIITPPTHATNGIILQGFGFNGKRTLLAA